MKALAHSYALGSELDKDNEDRVKGCPSCQAVMPAFAKASLHPWAWPTAPMKHIHVDFAGHIMGKMLLVSINVHSVGSEVSVMNSTTASKTISVLSDLFSHSEYQNS